MTGRADKSGAGNANLATPPISESDCGTQGKPRLHIFDTESGMARSASNLLLASLNAKPDLALCLPTGNTPRPLYASLRQSYQQGHVRFAQARLFMVDEYVGAAGDADWSFSRYLDRELIDHVDFAPRNIFKIDGAATDPEAEARRFEAAIDAIGGIDLAVLGLGANGHVAFNEPGTEADSSTNVARLSPDTLSANRAFLPADASPTHAITIGLGTIRASGAILLLVNGSSKRAALSTLIGGGDSRRWPVVALRDHPNLTVMATRSVVPAECPAAK